MPWLDENQVYYHALAIRNKIEFTTSLDVSETEIQSVLLRELNSFLADVKTVGVLTKVTGRVKEVFIDYHGHITVGIEWDSLHNHISSFDLFGCEFMPRIGSNGMSFLIPLHRQQRFSIY